MRLTKYEQETIINFNAGDEMASVYSQDPVWIRKLDKLVEKSPECYRVSKELGVGREYEMPKKLVVLLSKERAATLTPEQRKEASERMKKMNQK